MEARCRELGFLPFFRCGLPGFSVEEMIAPEYWFSDEEGAWEWKGPIARDGYCAYGKFYARKAGFVSLEWLPELVNWRRTRHLAPNEDAAMLDDVVLQTVQTEGSATIRELRRLLGFAAGRRTRTAADPVSEMPEGGRLSLDPILTRLQMELRLTIADFEYDVDRRGNRYGWGVARYATPESLYGPLRTGHTSEESFRRLCRHFRSLFPGVEDAKLLRLIG